MSTNTNVNPARLEMITSMLFGRKAALTIMANNPSLKEYSLKRLEELYGKPKKIIGTPKFEVQDLVVDTEAIADAFGFDRSNLKFIGGDNKKFRMVLDTMDAILSFVNIFPADNMEDVKSGIRLVAKTVQQYLPDMKSIGKLLAMAPGIAKYSKELIGFGEELDHAIEVLNHDGDNTVREAISIIRDGLKNLYRVDIEDINHQVSNIKTDDIKSAEKHDPEVIETTGKVVDADEVKDDKSSNNKKKKEEKKPVESNEKEAVAAYSQQMPPMMMQSQQPQQDVGYVPEFLNPGLDTQTKSVPEFIAENVMNVPKVQPMDRIFQPVEQQNPGQYIDPRIMDYPWVREIQRVANSLGYYVTPSIISDGGNRPVLIRIDTFGQNGAFLNDKSFVVDLGIIIDGRLGIWNAIQSSGNMMFLEFCNEAYALNTERTIDNNGRKEKVQVLNISLLEKIFKFGFTNLGGSLNKGDILYGERMIVTNRTIDLISMPTNGLSKDAKNLIKGGCIRAATALAQDPIVGRLRFKSVDSKTLEFVLTNENEPSFFMGPIENRKPIDVKFTPVLDEQGKFIPVNPKGGSDIKYSVSYNG